MTSAPPTRYRILVVDDEPRMIRFIRLNLEHDGFEVVEAADGLAALKQVRDTLPDLVLLDVAMPELDGFETLRLLREISTVPTEQYRWPSSLALASMVAVTRCTCSANTRRSATRASRAATTRCL